MKIFTGRNGVLAVGLFAIFGCAICDDGNSSSTNPPYELAGVRGHWPCVVLPGTTITVYGSKLGVVSLVDFVGGGTTPTNRTPTSFDLVVPAGSASGPITFKDIYGRQVGGTHPITVGPDTVVPEAETNDDVNGADATPMGGRTQGSGTLSSVADRDHFRRTCFMTGARYIVTVQPRVVGVVYVNGTGVPLDASGRGEFLATGDPQLFGLTGGTGTYTMTIGFVNP